MTLQIELTDDTEKLLKREAERQGIGPEELAKSLIEKSFVVGPPDTATLELLAKWDERDATDDPAEIERRNRDFEEFKNAINETRRAAGARIIYP